jgi:hypothetical protein
MAKKKLQEAPPIDYGDSPERMDPELERKLGSSQTTYGKEYPGFPKLKPTAKFRNFEEIVASKRFKDVVEKVKFYTGVRSIQGMGALQQLMMAMMQSFNNVVRIERRYKEDLERLAIDLVIKEMGIPKDAYQYDVKLISREEIDMSQMAKKPEEKPDEEEIEQQFGVNPTEEMEDFMSAMDNFDLEKAKRRFINALIQGSAKKSHYMFVLVQNELERMDPNLVKNYGILMSVNDLLYWMLPDQMLMGAAEGGEMGGGTEELDPETDPPTIKVRAVSFPILIHELVKGVMEAVGSQGLPDDPRAAEMVMGQTDTLPAEIWDLRLGPILWEKFTETYPDEVFEEDQRHIQSYLFSRFSRLSAKEFLGIAKKIMRGDPEGKSFIQKMTNEIIADLKKNQMNDLGFDSENEDEDDDNFQPK